MVTLIQKNAFENCSGGLAQLRVQNKVVDIFKNPEARDRCHCRLLDLYIEKVPPEAIEKELFYYCPIEKKAPPSPLDGTNFHRWFQRCVNLEVSQVIKQTIAFGRQGPPSYTKQKYHRKSYKKELATVLWSTHVRTYK